LSAAISSAKVVSVPEVVTTGVTAAAVTVIGRLALVPPAVTRIVWVPVPRAGTSTGAVKLPSDSVDGAGVDIADTPPISRSDRETYPGKSSPLIVTVSPEAAVALSTVIDAPGTEWYPPADRLVPDEGVPIDAETQLADGIVAVEGTTNEVPAGRSPALSAVTVATVVDP
jgi:hypothetical protein